MTTEQKAKAYDEALEMARKINSGEGVEAPPDWTICEVIFPELKDNEDERIRKSIIAIINNYVDNSNTFKPKLLAWLEKQGSTILSNSSNIGKDKQKPAWSEEDEQGYEDVDWCINKALHACNNEDEAGTCWFAQRWINSIKLRLGGK